MTPKLTLNHFSHKHPLHLSNYDETQKKTKYLVPCSACNLNASGWICSCNICNYILHFECATIPLQIHLPFHPNHAFSLQHEHQDGAIFNCYACAQVGDGFSYSCTSCKIDLHILCSTASQVLPYQSHKHVLELTTLPPSSGTKKFTCGICSCSSINHWLYQCQTCHDFDAHMTCATKPFYASGPCVTIPKPKPDDPIKEANASSSGGTIYTLPNGEKKKMKDMSQEEIGSLWGDFWATRGLPRI